MNEVMGTVVYTFKKYAKFMTGAGYSSANWRPLLLAKRFFLQTLA